MAIIVNTVLPSGFVATYARPMSSPSLRLDTGRVELAVALYKDATARFDGAEPAGLDRITVELTEDERSRIASVLYEAMTRSGHYEGGTPRDPDPEKVITKEKTV